MTTHSTVLNDIAFAARNGNHVATASSMLSNAEYVGVVLGNEVSIYPKTFNRSEVIAGCSKRNLHFLLVSGKSQRLEHFTSSLINSCKTNASDEVNAALNLLLNFPDLYVTEFNSEVTATVAPAVGVYPVNISTVGKSTWDKLLTSERYKKNVTGRSGDIRWAIAMKMYMDKALRLGVKPFATYKRDYSRKDLTETYKHILSIASSFESQLRTNLLERDFISKETRTTKPWAFKEVSYNNGRFICVLNKSWRVVEDGLPVKVIKHLVRNENFEKNEDGAGWVHTLSGNATLRVRLRSAGKIDVDLFLIFNKDKIMHTFKLEGMKIRAMLDEFHTIARHWFSSKRF